MSEKILLGWYIWSRVDVRVKRRVLCNSTFQRENIRARRRKEMEKPSPHLLTQGVSKWTGNLNSMQFLPQFCTRRKPEPWETWNVAFTSNHFLNIQATVEQMVWISLSRVSSVVCTSMSRGWTIVIWRTLLSQVLIWYWLSVEGDRDEPKHARWVQLGRNILDRSSFKIIRTVIVIVLPGWQLIRWLPGLSNLCF